MQRQKENYDYCDLQYSLHQVIMSNYWASAYKVGFNLQQLQSGALIQLIEALLTM